MDAFLIYSLKLAVFLSVLYICIKAFLSRETFFSFNRWVLLGGIGLCLLLSLVTLTVSERMATLLPLSIVEEYFVQAPQEEVVIDNSTYYEMVSAEYAENVEEMQEVPSVSMNPSQVLLLIYLAGLFVNLFLLGRSAYLMLKIIRSNPKQNYKGYKLILVKESIVPFSWGRYIVISKADFYDNPDEILTHEIAHIKHRHSLDIILMECVLLQQWFNPAAWLLKRELKDMHEYQADMSVLESGIDTTKYQLLLVKKAVGASSYTLANSFNHSKIKKRITMMLKEKSSKWARLKLLLLLPLGALTVFAFARPETENVGDNFSIDEVTKNISNETSYGDTNGDIVHTYINGELIATHSLDKDVVGEARLGKFNLIHTTNAQNLATTIYPHEFSLKANPEESDYSKIKTYVSGGKKYTDKEFLNKYQGYMSFLERSKAVERNENVVEVYGELADGSKTATFYMVKMEEGSVIHKKLYDSLQKDNPRKKVVVYSRIGEEGEILFSYPTAYDEAKEGEKPILDKFVKYMIGGKEYTQNEFEKLVNGKEFFKSKADIKSGETDILEFHCITQKRFETPTWYMVKIKEGKNWRDALKEGGEGSRLELMSPEKKDDAHDIQQKKEKPNYYKYTKYEVNGETMSLAEYDKLKANSLEILHEEYIPFAKGRVVKITGIFNTGEKANHSYYREMFIDGKAPSRSHVEFIIDSVAYDYAEGNQKAAGVKYATMEEAKKGKSASTKPKTCQIKSKDGSRSSKVFYTVSFTAPPPPPPM